MMKRTNRNGSAIMSMRWLRSWLTDISTLETSCEPM